MKNKKGLNVGKLPSGDKSSGKLGAADGKGRADLKPKGGTTKEPGGNFAAGGKRY